MAVNHRKSARELFEAALEIHREERGAWLAEACGGDVRLRHDVEALLASLEDAPTGGLLPPLRVPVAPPGGRVGPYRCLRELGRGGMGVVYLAERVDGGPPVALKLVREGALAGPEQVRRFLLEQRALSRLDHPGIARLRDAGLAENGMPYLVMEHVDGLPIDRWCDERRVDVAGRLRLFLAVCRAVEHAHLRGVLHRDLKPSNVLVTPAGEVKLLDFGIAKVEGEEGLTTPGLPLLTPEYASPEQAAGERATPASDVFSLGVMLYEILSGQRPRRVAERTLENVVLAFCSDGTLPPSVALLRAGEEAAAARGSTPAQLSRRLRRRLDPIVMKAIAAEPERRYATAAGLAEALERVLEGRPTPPTPCTLLGRAALFVGRHRLRLAAALAGVATILAALAAALLHERAPERRGPSPTPQERPASEGGNEGPGALRVLPRDGGTRKEDGSGCDEGDAEWDESFRKAG